MKKTALIMMLLLTTLTFAQKSDLRNDPGYAEFGDLSIFDNGNMVAEVLIEGTLLRMVAKMMKEKDPEMYELLSGLKLVKVNAFEATKENHETITGIIKKMDAKLTGKGWNRIVKYRDRAERANIYIKTNDEDEIIGLVVMAIGDDNEAAFVNIVGNINLETIGRLSEKFDIPELDKIDDNGKDENIEADK